MIFAAYEEEYLVTLKTCQSADWQTCTALICKHAEQASNLVEDGLNAMLATEVCLSSMHAVAKTNSLGDIPGMGRQSIIHATGTATVPRPNAWLVMKSVPNPARTPVAGSAERGDLGK